MGGTWAITATRVLNSFARSFNKGFRSWNNTQRARINWTCSWPWRRPMKPGGRSASRPYLAKPSQPKRIPSPWFINGIKKVLKRPGKKPSPTMSACCKPRRRATRPRTRAAFCGASSSVSIPASAVTTAFSRTNSCSLDNNLMKLSAHLLTVSCLLFCTEASSQTVVYSLTYSETRTSFQAHFANVSPFPGRRSDDENLSMLRGTRKTEIYSLSLADGKRTLLFSDEGLHLQIMATGAVAGDGKPYIAAFWRERRTSPTPTVTSEEALYEISLDGSNHFRKIADAQPNQPPAILNPQSTRAAFEMFKDCKFVVSIYAVPEWKLLHTWDLAKLMQTHCPACNPLSYGWLADGKHLYIELGLAGEEEGDLASANTPGTYLLSEDGTDL